MHLRYALQLHDPGVLIAAYRIGRVLGYGGFGAVYAVERRGSTTRLALKETFDAQSIAAFQREFATLHRLRHPHLPIYHDMFEYDGNGYLVMELVPGQSLQDILDDGSGALPETQVLGYAVQLCDVLTFLHQQHPPILHRDMKPANARLTPEGRIKLVDFGLLKRGGQLTRVTIRGIGTPAYAPIEQYGGDADRTDVRSELYSLGATLYHLMTGVEPPPATDRVAAERDPLRPPQQLVPELSTPVADALMQALAISQRDRLASIEEFRRALLSSPAPLIPALPQRISRTTPPPAPTPAIDRLVALLQGPHEAIRGIAWAPDGRWLAGPSGRNLFVWDVQHGRLEKTLNVRQDTILCTDWSDDGQMIISGSWDGLICLSRLDGAATQTLGRQRGAVTRVRFSPDGALAVSGGWDETVWIWDVGAQAAITQIPSPGGRVADLAWSHDGRRLALAAFDGTIRVIESSSGQTIRRIDAHEGVARCVTWSPEGRMLASGGDDGRLIIWAEADGTLIERVEAHRGMTASLDWRADGRMLASGGMDGNLRLWGAGFDGTLRTLFDLHGHNGSIWGVAFSPDARFLASASGDWTVRLWRV
ncbi:MAG: protein kinase [Oscillochloris sp.]|nr:protein kinase [Oscillochloris sp.]